MAYEDFTTFTEVDQETAITVTSTKVDWSNVHPRFHTGYTYYDKGAGHFSGDFTHKFEVYVSASGAYQYAQSTFWMLANIVGDHKAVIDASEDACSFYLYHEANRFAYLNVIENGTPITDYWYTGLSLSTLYFIEIVRDDDGGANNTGRYTAYIRTGSHTGALQDTLIVDSSVGEQNDFRYVYGTASYDDNSGSGSAVSLYVQNLDLGTISHDLNAGSPGCLSQISAPLLTKIADTQANAVECLSQVTAPSLESGWLYNQDVSCETQITVPSFTVKREIAIPNIESSTEVGIPDFHRSFEINAPDVSSLTEVTAASIYKELFPSDIECSSEVEAADLEWIMVGRMNVTLPMITAEISGGHGGFLNVELPMITAEMRGGAQLNVTLPMITAELTGSVGIKADLNVTLPMIKAEMAGTVEVLGELNVTLPMITARMTGTTGQVGQLNVTLPMIIAQLSGYTDIDGQLNVTLPMIEAYLTGTVERESCEILRYEEPELE